MGEVVGHDDDAGGYGEQESDFIKGAALRAGVWAPGSESEFTNFSSSPLLNVSESNF